MQNSEEASCARWQTRMRSAQAFIAGSAARRSWLAYDTDPIELAFRHLCIVRKHADDRLVDKDLSVETLDEGVDFFVRFRLRVNHDAIRAPRSRPYNGQWHPPRSSQQSVTRTAR